jgi:hypothetical protein
MAGNGLLMDVYRALTAPKTPLDVYTANTPPNNINQLWSFEPGPQPGSFFIVSNLGADLAVDIENSNPTARTRVVLNPMSSPPVNSQLWMFEPLLPGAPISPGYFKNLAAPNLVIDVKGGFPAPRGTELIIFSKNHPVSGNQLWFILANRLNVYNPNILPITQAGQGFSIIGTGFQANTVVLATYSYLTDDESSIEEGSFFALTDLIGTFTADAPLVNLDAPGVLSVGLIISFPHFPDYINARWDGNAFIAQWVSP